MNHRKLFLLIIATMVTSANAEVKTWSPFLGSDDWHGGLNWAPSGVPQANDDVRIDLDDDQVVLNGDTANLFALFLVNSADLRTNGHTLRADSVFVGSTFGTSRLEIDPASGLSAVINELTFQELGQLDMDGGHIRVGSLEVRAGASIVGSGTIELDGAQGSAIADVAGDITVPAGQTLAFERGAFAPALVNVSGDVLMNMNSNLAIDGQLTMDGSMTVLGADSIVPAEPTISGSFPVVIDGLLQLSRDVHLTFDARVRFNDGADLRFLNSFRDDQVVNFNQNVSFSGGSYTGLGGLRANSTVLILDDTTISVERFEVANSFSGPDLTVREGATLTLDVENFGITCFECDAAAHFRVETGGAIHALQSWGNAGITALADGARITGQEFRPGFLEADAGSEGIIEAPAVLDETILRGDGTIRFDGPTTYEFVFNEGFRRIVQNGDATLVGGSTVRLTRGSFDNQPLALWEIAGSDGASTVVGTNSTALVSDITTLAAGQGSIAVLNMSSNMVVTDSIFVGGSTTAAAGNGTFNVSGSEFLDVEIGDRLVVYSTGTVNIDGSNLTTKNLELEAGATLNLNHGRLIIEGGTATGLGTSFLFGSGEGLDPEFSVKGGGLVEVTFAWHIGSGVGNSGRTEVTGTGSFDPDSTDPLVRSTLRNTGGGGGADLVVGPAGHGELLVSTGGLVEFTDDIIIGREATGSGVVEVSGLQGVGDFPQSTLRTTAGGGSAILVGHNGQGSLEVDNGGIVESAGDIFIANQPGSVGDVILKPGTFFSGGLEFYTLITAADDIVIGGGETNGGVGTLTIEERASAVAGDVFRLRNANSRFTLKGGEFSAGRFFHIDDGNLELKWGHGEITSTGSMVTSDVVLGDGTSSEPMHLIVAEGADAVFGEVDVASNGILEVGGLASFNGMTVGNGNLKISGRAEINLLNSGQGTVDLVGGTLAITGPQAGDVDYAVTVSGSASIEVPVGRFFALDGSITSVPGGGADQITKYGGGSLILTTFKAFDGTIGIEGGRVVANHASGSNLGTGSIKIFADATLTGRGSVDMIDAFAGGTVAPGDDAAQLNALAANFSTGSILAIEIGGLTPGVQHDVLAVDGITTLLGGVLDVSLIAGFTPNEGDRFEILTANTLLGSFDVHDLPDIGNLNWLVDYSSTNLALVVTSALAGDYNDDGVVDAADYAVWRDNLGAPAGTLPNDPVGGEIGSSQYNTWKSNFGNQMPASATLHAVSVPEPSTCVLLTLLAAACTYRYYRARH